MGGTGQLSSGRPRRDRPNKPVALPNFDIAGACLVANVLERGFVVVRTELQTIQDLPGLAEQVCAIFWHLDPNRPRGIDLRQPAAPW